MRLNQRRKGYERHRRHWLELGGSMLTACVMSDVYEGDEGTQCVVNTLHKPMALANRHATQSSAKQRQPVDLESEAEFHALLRYWNDQRKPSRGYSACGASKPFSDWESEPAALSTVAIGEALLSAGRGGAPGANRVERAAALAVPLTRGLTWRVASTLMRDELSRRAYPLISEVFDSPLSAPLLYRET